jgi:SAM-dependent methyltransferase
MLTMGVVFSPRLRCQGGKAVLSEVRDYSASTPEWRLVHEVTAKVDREHFWHIARNEKILQSIGVAHKNLADLSFLEVGSGTGNVCGYLRANGLKNVEGWEVNPDALAIARQRFPLVNFKDFDFVNGKSSQKFDSVGFFDCLEHFEHDQDCLQIIRDHIKVGGSLIITVPAHMRLWSWHDSAFGHFRRYSKQEIVQKLRATGFDVVRAQYFMGLLAPALLLRKTHGSAEADTYAELERRYRAESGLSSPVVNSLALNALRLESAVMGGADLGFGASLAVVARRLA